jgi:ABC-2 type transport system ATP-binding protein
MPQSFVVGIREAHKRFGDTVALAGITFRVDPDEWVGLLGPNGAGKTTLVRAIAGRVRLDSGRVTMGGVPGRSFGLVPQENAIYPFMTARENLEVFGRLYGLQGSTLLARVDWALDWAGLVERADEVTGGYSGGMKRRLNLACGVLHRPGLVLLDEPTTGVDPQSRERIFAMLEELRRGGAALLYTTHQLSDAEGVCTRVVIIDRGRIVAEGTPDELIERTLGRMPEVILTLDRPAAREALPQGACADGRTVRVRVDDLGTGLPSLLGGFREAGYGVDDVRVVRPDLHAVFLHLTGRELRE